MKKEANKNRTVVKKQHPKSSSNNNPVASSSIAFWGGIALVVFLGLLIYSNSFDCAFQFDDKHNITDNPAIRSLSSFKDMWDLNHSRFVSFYTFALNYHFNQLNVWGYHFINLLIHLINSCLVYGLVLSMFRTPVLEKSTSARQSNAIALATALLFVSHPLATGAVTYIVQRMASLVALFYFSSVGCYFKGRLSAGTKRYLYYAGAIISTVLAVLTKENAYTIPFAIVLIELFFFNTEKIKIVFTDRRVLLPLLGLAVFLTFTIVTFSFKVLKPIAPSVYNLQEITPGNYFFTQLSVLVKYLQLLILPINQNVDYDFPISQSLFEWKPLLSGIFLLGLLTLGVLLYNRNRLISFGIFWFFLTIALESSFIPISDVIFEHRTYIPSFGYCIVFSVIMYSYVRNRSKTIANFLVVFFVLTNSVLAHQRNNVWKNEISLWSDVVSKSPDKARGYMNRGYAYGNAQQWKNAIADFSKVNEINPDYHASAYYNLGYAYWSLGQKETCIDHFSKAIAIDSLYADAFYARGTAYYYSNQPDKANADYTTVIRIAPRYSRAYFSRGLLYSNLKDPGNAISDFNKAIEFDATIADYYFNRGIAFGNNNEWANAIRDFSKTIELDPNNKAAYSNLEYARSRMKN